MLSAKVHLPPSRVREVEKECNQRERFYWGGYDDEIFRKEARRKRKIRKSGSVKGAKE